MTSRDPLRPMSAQWLGVYVETREMLGETVWSVTISSSGQDARTRLSTERGPAYEYALKWSEQLDLPLFDNHDQAATA